MLEEIGKNDSTVMGMTKIIFFFYSGFAKFSKKNQQGFSWLNFFLIIWKIYFQPIIAN